MGEAKVQSFAALTTSIVGAVVSLAIPARLVPDGLGAQILMFLMGVFGLYAVFELSLLAGSWWRYRKLLGRWVYVSWRNEDPEQTSFSLLRFGIAPGGGLKYDVTTYRSCAHAQAAAQGKQVIPTGRAVSVSARFDDDSGCINLIYEFRPTGQDARRGIVRINDQPGAVLEAHWMSITKGGVNQGAWLAARPGEAFENLLADLPAHRGDVVGRLGAHEPAPSPTPPRSSPSRRSRAASAP